MDLCLILTYCMTLFHAYLSGIILHQLHPLLKYWLITESQIHWFALLYKDFVHIVPSIYNPHLFLSYFTSHAKRITYPFYYKPSYFVKIRPYPQLYPPTRPTFYSFLLPTVLYENCLCPSLSLHQIMSF